MSLDSATPAQCARPGLGRPLVVGGGVALPPQSPAGDSVLGRVPLRHQPLVDAAGVARARPELLAKTGEAAALRSGTFVQVLAPPPAGTVTANLRKRGLMTNDPWPVTDADDAWIHGGYGDVSFDPLYESPRLKLPFSLIQTSEGWIARNAEMGYWAFGVGADDAIQAWEDRILAQPDKPRKKPEATPEVTEWVEQCGACGNGPSEPGPFGRNHFVPLGDRTVCDVCVDEASQSIQVKRAAAAMGQPGPFLYDTSQIEGHPEDRPRDLGERPPQETAEVWEWLNRRARGGSYMAHHIGQRLVLLHEKMSELRHRMADAQDEARAR